MCFASLLDGHGGGRRLTLRATRGDRIDASGDQRGGRLVQLTRAAQRNGRIGAQPCRLPRRSNRNSHERLPRSVI